MNYKDKAGGLSPVQLGCSSRTFTELQGVSKKVSIKTFENFNSDLFITVIRNF